MAFSFIIFYFAYINLEPTKISTGIPIIKLIPIILISLSLVMIFFVLCNLEKFKINQLN